MTDTKFLIDTHVFLWAVNGDKRLSAAHREILEARAGLHFSVASIWEIAIKISTGKLTVDGDLLAVINARDVRILPVNERHALRTADLPLPHRDPFDRMLIAQAQLEGLTILTNDRWFETYGVTIV